MPRNVAHPMGQPSGPWFGTATVYRLDPPRGHVSHVVVSGIDVGQLREAAVFVADCRGERMSDVELAAVKGTTDHADALVLLGYRIRSDEPNVAFAARQLDKHAEDVVQRARADVEAMVTQKAAQLGLPTGQAAGLLELPLMPGEDRPELESPR